MFRLDTLYNPITSRPFLSDHTYREILPSSLLRPYVSCYWGTPGPLAAENGASANVRVIPDGCMDIIIEVNHTKGRLSGRFSGMQCGPFLAGGQNRTDVTSTFAIRFYFWAVSLFAGFSLGEAGNQTVGLEESFTGWLKEFEPFLYVERLTDRVFLADRLLLRKMNEGRANAAVMNGVYHILRTKGGSSVKSAVAYACAGQRQMERLFQQHIGLSIKKTAGIVRYQHLWREIAFSTRFDYQDAVMAYGFSDQAHLLNSFKKHHGLYPAEAKALAAKAGRDVAFLQYE